MIKKYIYFHFIVTLILLCDISNAGPLENLEWLKKENLTIPIVLNINDKKLDLDKNINEIIEYYHNKLPDYYFLPRYQVSEKNKACAVNIKKNLYQLRSSDKLVELPADLTWSEDPFNDRNWQYLFHSFRFSNCLLDGYYTLQDPWYLDRLKFLVIDWWQDNFKQSHPSVYSWDDHSTANRLHEILRIFEYLRRLNKLDEAFTKAAIRAIYWHTRILAEEKPFYTENHNHGLIQSRIIFESSQIAHEFPLATIWQAVSINRLKNEVDFALTSEGIHKENSPAYHGWISVYIAETNKVVTHYTKEPLLGNSTELQEGGLNFLTIITRPDRTLPELGDTMKGASPVAKYPDEVELASIPYYQYMITGGKKGIKPLQNTSIFPESGYFIYRDKWDEVGKNTAMQLILKCGYLAKGHRHNDDGNVLLYGLGEDWLIDGGMYGYEYDKYRNHVTSPSAHNISFPYEAKDSPLWDHQNINSFETRIQNYKNNWGLIEADNNLATCESHMFVGLTYKRRLEITGERSFKLTDSLISEDLHNNIEKKFITAFKVPDNKIVYINYSKKVIMILNVSGSSGLKINYNKEFVDIKVCQGEGGDITSLETTAWLKMSPAKTIAFISKGRSFSAAFDLQLVESPNIQGFERIKIGRVETEVIVKEEENQFSFFVKQGMKNIKIAFYLFKDGERVDTKWYSEDFLYVVNKKKYGDGEYFVRYFLVDKNEQNPSKVKKVEIGSSKKITISQLEKHSQGGVFIWFDAILLTMITLLSRRRIMFSLTN